MRARHATFRKLFAMTILRWLLPCAVLLAGGAVAIQGAQAQDLLPGSGSAEESSAQKAPASQADLYGRETPRSLASALVAAFANGDYDRAAHYLEPAADQQPSARDTRPALAQRLQQQLDRSGSLLPFPALSSESAGATDDGLPIDQERMDPSGPATASCR